MYRIKIIIVILIFGILVYNAQALNDNGLVAEWHFDEGKGNIAKDTSGNGNDGIIHGATWVDGKIGKALQFDGTDDYVIASSTGFPIGASDRTIEFWVKSPNMAVGNKFLVGWGSATTNGMSSLIMGWKNLPSRKFAFWGHANDFESVSTLNDNTWYHLAFTLEGTTGKLYLNGFLDITISISGLNTPSGTDLYIADFTSTMSNFNGLIDEVRIYNRALTAEEIKAHYEGVQTALTITKTASPHSIKQGQTTTITITLKNTGTTEIKDIEVADTIPSDLIFVGGETSKKYASLKTKDSREFQYILQSKEAGTFNLDPAIATYADEKGNYYTAKSNTTKIKVIPSLITTSPGPTVTLEAPKFSALSVKKSASPYSIRQFQETTITISLENSGNSDITDIEVMDSIHPSFDLVKGEFPNPKKYDIIRQGESREIQYTIKAKESGTFSLDPVIVTYPDQEGNIQEVRSGPISVKVIPSFEGSQDLSSRQPPKSASVSLHGEKTDVVLREDILLKLSAVNLITKPVMHVQVIIIPPSGMSVTSSEFVKSGAGQFTTTYELEPGQGRDIEVRIKSNQVGDFEVKGRIIYYFGKEKDKAEDYTLSLPIKVRKEPVYTPKPTPTTTSTKTPGFSLIIAFGAILLFWCFSRK